jgi:hypothetical protein
VTARLPLPPEEAACPELVAWEVEVDTLSGYIFAESAPAARMAAVLAYRRAGFGRGRKYWPPGVRARRRPRLDGSNLRHLAGRRVWTSEAVESSL